MLRLSNIKFSVIDLIKKDEIKELKIKVSKILKIKINEFNYFKISKKSIDARDKKNVVYIYSVDFKLNNENKFLKIKDISKIEPFNYMVKNVKSEISPVIVGFGPAGMMAGLILAKAGLKPIIIERGKKVDDRKKDVDNFWQTGILNINSNVQFGEGGAGTFSDGKLTTGIKDKRCRVVVEEFVNAGAPEEILYLSKPHIGTDNLVTVVKNIRQKIENLGGKILFQNKLIDIVEKDEVLKSIIVEDSAKTYEINTNKLILAIGHSARDTFEMLNKKLFIEKKPFSVGVRIEHLQKNINEAQYGEFAKYLPPADYKLFSHLSNGRGAYTFCMCPGGVVVAAASEENHIVTNGMSYYKRDNKNANSALLIEVYPSDFMLESPLAGVKFQRELEKKAFILGGSNYNAPAQKIGDFFNNKKTISFGRVFPTYKPGVTGTNLKELFPGFIYNSIGLALEEMDKKIKGFADYDSVMTAVETRSSSPIRIVRNNNFYSNIKGIIPCGEGCGYAGGIISAAVDGIKCAEAIINSI